MQGYKVSAFRDWGGGALRPENTLENLGAAYCVVYPTPELAATIAMDLSAECEDMGRDGISYQVVPTTSRDLVVMQLRELESRVERLSEELSSFGTMLSLSPSSVRVGSRIHEAAGTLEVLATDLYLLGSDYAHASESLSAVAERCASDHYNSAEVIMPTPDDWQELDHGAILRAQGFEVTDENVATFCALLEDAFARRHELERGSA